MNSTSELDLVPSVARIDKCYVTGYDSSVRIRNFAHKGLRRLYEENDPKGVPAASVDKLRKIFAFLDAMEDAAELRSIPAWRPHLLTGDRKGAWSLHVTRNWRMTFSIDAAENEVCDVTLEDYH